MSKRKDSFVLNWILGSNRNVQERIVLYEDSSSDKSGSNEDENAAQQKNDAKDKFKFEQKSRKTMFRGFASVIYVCIEELTTLKRFCRRSADPSWIAPTEYKTIEQIYNNPDDSFKMYKLDDMQKSLKDICILLNIMSNFLQELQNDETFSAFQKSVDILMQHIQDEIILIDDLNSMYQYKYFLEVSIVKEHIESKEQLIHFKDEAYSLKLMYENVSERGKYSYNSDWETARLQQKYWSVWKETQTLEDSISKCIENIADENRVHAEMELYCAEYIQDLNREIDEWQRKYEAELENNDSKLIFLKDEQESLIVGLADLKVVYNKRTNDIKQWLEYSAEKKVVDDYNRILAMAATKIQAWWRGQMFRRKLGPYRKKRGKISAKKRR